MSDTTVLFPKKKDDNLVVISFRTTPRNAAVLSKLEKYSGRKRSAILNDMLERYLPYFGNAVRSTLDLRILADELPVEAAAGIATPTAGEQRGGDTSPLVTPPVKPSRDRKKSSGRAGQTPAGQPAVEHKVPAKPRKRGSRKEAVTV